MADHDKTDPAVESVKTTVSARRSDVPEDELHERAEAAVDDLAGGSTTAFTVPLAVNRVRSEVTEEHGLPDSESAHKGEE